MATLDPKLYSSLSDSTKKLLLNILKKLTIGEKLTSSDVGMLGFSFSCAREKDVSELFHTTARQVRNWVKDGCPKRPDGHFDLFQVHDWLLSREVQKKTINSEDNLKDQKTQKEIEKITLQSQKLNLELDEIRKNSINKDLHERTKKTIIESFVNFLINSLKRNLATIRAIPDSEVNTELDQLAIQMTRHMVTTAKQAERD